MQPGPSSRPDATEPDEPAAGLAEWVDPVGSVAPVVRDPSDERRHPDPGDPNWHEVFDLTFWSPRATFGGHITVFLWPHRRRSWYWASVVEEGRRPVALLETDVALPRRGLELRAPGLWADHNCESPFEHWSYSLEAFAVRLDRPEDAVADFRGERVPLGFDIEWEAVDAPALDLVPPAHGYQQAGRVHGEVLVGRDAYDLDGYGVRGHWWGTTWWPAAVGAPTGTPRARPEPPDVVSGAVDGPGRVGHPQRAGGEDRELVGRSLTRLPVPGGARRLDRRLQRGRDGPRWLTDADADPDPDTDPDTGRGRGSG